MAVIICIFSLNRAVKGNELSTYGIIRFRIFQREPRLSCMLARFVRMQIHLACAKATAISGKGVNKANRKLMKLSPRINVSVE